MAMLIGKEGLLNWLFGEFIDWNNLLEGNTLFRRVEKKRQVIIVLVYI